MIVIYGVIFSMGVFRSTYAYVITKRQRGKNRAIETLQKINRNILKQKVKE